MNSNRNAGNLPAVELWYNPTVSGLGTELGQQRFTGLGGLEVARMQQPLMLKYGTDYLVRLKTDTNNNIVNFNLGFGED